MHVDGDDDEILINSQMQHKQQRRVTNANKTRALATSRRPSRSIRRSKQSRCDVMWSMVCARIESIWWGERRYGIDCAHGLTATHHICCIGASHKYLCDDVSAPNTPRFRCDDAWRRATRDRCLVVDVADTSTLPRVLTCDPVRWVPLVFETKKGTVAKTNLIDRVRF